MEKTRDQRDFKVVLWISLERHTMSARKRYSGVQKGPLVIAGVWDHYEQHFFSFKIKFLWILSIMCCMRLSTRFSFCARSSGSVHRELSEAEKPEPASSPKPSWSQPGCILLLSHEARVHWRSPQLHGLIRSFNVLRWKSCLISSRQPAGCYNNITLCCHNSD